MLFRRSHLVYLVPSAILGVLLAPVAASANSILVCPPGNSVCIDETAADTTPPTTPNMTFSNAIPSSPFILSATATPTVGATSPESWDIHVHLQGTALSSAGNSFFQLLETAPPDAPVSDSLEGINSTFRPDGTTDQLFRLISDSEAGQLTTSCIAAAPGTCVVETGDSQLAITGIVISGQTYNIYLASALGEATVPEPATVPLFGTGLIGLVGLRFLRRRC